MKPIGKKISLICCILVAGAAYFGLLNHTPHGTECVKSTSPDGTYIAERCFLGMQGFRSDNGRYVARVFDAKSGSLLAESVFETPVPDFSWSTGFYYSDLKQARYVGPAVYFQRGGEDGDGSSISLPPSTWDRLLARRPRLGD
jgi:hypothetical protein